MDRIDDVLADWQAIAPDQATHLESLGLAARVRLLGRRFEEQADRLLQEQLELPIWGYDLLAALYRAGKPYRLSAGELSRAIVLSPGAMTNRITRLEEKGLLNRQPDPKDRRGVLVALSPAGVALVRRAFPLRVQAAVGSVEALTPEEQVALNALLRKLVSA